MPGSIAAIIASTSTTVVGSKPLVAVKDVWKKFIHEGNEVVIASAAEYPSAWSFGYNTRRFLENGDLGASMIGNGPVVVPKNGGPIYLAQSGSPVEDQLR